jgi:hypothetical protein
VDKVATVAIMAAILKGVDVLTTQPNDNLATDAQLAASALSLWEAVRGVIPLYIDEEGREHYQF